VVIYVATDSRSIIELASMTVIVEQSQNCNSFCGLIAASPSAAMELILPQVGLST
jgi:hypothetical protein